MEGIKENLNIIRIEPNWPESIEGQSQWKKFIYYKTRRIDMF